MDHDKDAAEKLSEPTEPTEPSGEPTEARETKHSTEPEVKWQCEAWEHEETGKEEETESESGEPQGGAGKVDLKDQALQAKVLVQQTCRGLLSRPGTVVDLFIVGWRCWFLFLKTLETALSVSPRSSPYALDVLCSLKDLSLPQSREEARRRVLDNYTSYSGEYFWLLRNVVCFCVCRFASPWRVGMAVVFLAVCGFVPLEDRRVGPYVMQRDLQRVFLVMVAVCGSGVVDVVSWCLIFACPVVLLHLFLHNSSVTSHRPLFSNLLRS